MFLRRRRARLSHEQVKAQMDQQEQEIEDMKRRVRILEIEAGIFSPRLKEVNGK